MTSTIRIQTFLTLLDTIHDYGNVSRATKVFQGKGDVEDKPKQEDDGETNEGDEDTGTFNTAILIDFLMLGYMHNEFKRIIGIDLNQNYIVRPDDCDHITYKDPENASKSTTKTMFKNLSQYSRCPPSKPNAWPRFHHAPASA